MQSLLETELSEENAKISQSPLGNLRKKHHILTPRQSERNLGIDLSSGKIRKSTRFQIGGIGRNYKNFLTSITNNAVEIDYLQDYHECVKFQSIGFEGNMAELIPPTVTKAANRQQMVVSLGNLVFITVITVVHLDRVVGESIFIK